MIQVVGGSNAPSSSFTCHIDNLGRLEAVQKMCGGILQRRNEASPCSFVGTAALQSPRLKCKVSSAALLMWTLFPQLALLSLTGMLPNQRLLVFPGFMRRKWKSAMFQQVST